METKEIAILTYSQVEKTEELLLVVHHKDTQTPIGLASVHEEQFVWADTHTPIVNPTGYKYSIPANYSK